MQIPAELDRLRDLLHDDESDLEAVLDLMNSLAGRAPMNALAFELRAGRCEEAVQVASEELPAARRFPWIDYASTIALFKAYALTWLGRRDEAQIELRSLPPQTVVFVHDLAFSARDLAAGVIDPGRRPFA